ncbi:transcriptional regulator family: Fungal Specific TF [Paecilomyces variotii]|nr:transcriptional regulator family: Fungal Specific TF [Paecilomyces variotii]
MVGVPRSKACLLCLQRRVKCDELRPGCSQCQKYGVACPGYNKALKFQDQGPLLRQKFGSRAVTKQNSLQGFQSSIDERVVPSLVSISMSKQEPNVFRDFVLTAFPRWFGLNKHRVQVTWVAYVSEQLGKNPALDAAVYCITCAFMGHSRRDKRLKESSFEMYSKALNLLKESVKDGTALCSRESISTSILLAMFEAYTATSNDAWARHASGASMMMSLRGAESHHFGFDRSLYISFRSFLVAQAFVEGKPCMFEKPEWQTLIDQIRKEDMADPRVDEPIAVFIDISDRLFMEIVKFPGLVSEARALISSPGRGTYERKNLMAKILNAREVTSTLAADMRNALAAHGHLSRGGYRVPFIGPVPSTFPEAFANSLLRGTDMALSVLDFQLADLATEGAADRPVSRPFRIISNLAAGETSQSSEAADDTRQVNEWLDKVASSMGMEGMAIVL